MAHHSIKLEYPHDQIPLVLRSSYKEDTYYGVDHFESKKIKIVQAKYGCRHSFHTLPGKLTASLHPFTWDRLERCFRIELDQKETVHLNTLEEAIMHYQGF